MEGLNSWEGISVGLFKTIDWELDLVSCHQAKPCEAAVSHWIYDKDHVDSVMLSHNEHSHAS